MEKKGIKIAAQNRKAYHDYFVEDRLEAGIELRGTEVKSIRAGTLNLKDSYCVVKNGEAKDSNTVPGSPSHRASTTGFFTM